MYSLFVIIIIFVLDTWHQNST